MPGTGSDLVGRIAPDAFLLAVRQAPVAMFLVDVEGAFTLVNGAACEFFGRTADDLHRCTWQQITHPDDLAADLELVARVVSGEIDSYRLVKRYLRPDGSVVHGDLSVAGARSDEGQLLFFVVAISDITEPARARAEARRSRERLRGILDTLLDPWVYLRPVRDDSGAVVDFVYEDANTAACQENGLGRDEMLGRTVLELLPEHRGSEVFEGYVRVVETGEPLTLDDYPFVSVRQGGTSRWFDNRAVLVDGGLSLSWRDVTERVTARMRLADQARQDALTGLANRVVLDETLETLLSHPPRTGVRTLVLYCDLDHLKEINDSHGHPYGDAVLVAVADRLVGAVRSSDLVARVGGDEFVVVAPGIQDEQAAEQLAAKVSESVARPVRHVGVEVTPTISVGFALVDEGSGALAALAAADAALLAAKAARSA